MKAKIADIAKRFREEIAKCSDFDSLQTIKVKFLGKSGELTGQLKCMKELPPEERPAFGSLVNSVKQELEQLYAQTAERLKISALEARLESEKEDITIEKKLSCRGTIHPINKVTDEIVDMFVGLGFKTVEGPEIETDYYNFQALNLPADHPARDMQDTYYLSNGQLLKTHTSAAQNTILRKYAADLEKGIPLRAIFPGRCFRNEKIDACHENTFFQMEGMMVDRDISISNLIYFMKTMLSEVFQKDVTVRLRPGFFPFVEPGFELDIQCLICGGEACSSCKDSGWLELCPCGMIHPNVLKAGGIDPEKYSGFAFGLGLTRLAMMKYGVKDIRVFNSCNLKSLSQFTNSSFTVPDGTKKEEA